MSERNQELIDENIINDPKNYAAIYARVSTEKDNNSIDAQIDEAKKIVNEESLLVYGIYIDHVSGRMVPPQNRKGFGKLLTDAKAGCFKTIVVYKHDRLVRNLRDWVDLKAQLARLRINIIFSDKTEYISDKSLQGDFLENLMVMVAELEPNNIKERASHGKHFRRLQGVYSAGKKPFGYIRNKTEDKIILKNLSRINIKSYYSENPLEACFVRFIFKYYEKLMGEDKVNASLIKKVILSFFNELGNQDISIEKLLLIKSRSKDELLCKLIEEMIEILKKTEVRDTVNLMNDMNKIKEHLELVTNIKTILNNTVYSSYMLEKVDTENKGIIMVNGVPKLDIKSFYVPVCNVDKIVDLKTAEKVICHFYLNNIKDDEEEYLFRSKIYCDVCGKKMHLYDGLLRCSDPPKNKKCKTYSKTNLTEAILSCVIDEILGTKIDRGFHVFSSLVNEKIDRKWTKNSIKSILANEDYTGLIVWDKKGGVRNPVKHSNPIKSPNAHENIVSNELWMETQKIRQLQDNNPKYLTTKFLLKGFLQCGYCGETLKTKNNGGKKGRVYYCKKEEGKWELCVDADEIESKVVKYIGELLTNSLSEEKIDYLFERYISNIKTQKELYYKQINEVEEEIKYAKQCFNECENEIQRLEKTLGDIDKSLIDKQIIFIESLEELRSYLNINITLLETNREAANKEYIKPVPSKETFIGFLAEKKALLDIFKSISNKKSYLRCMRTLFYDLVDKIIVSKNKKEIGLEIILK